MAQSDVDPTGRCDACNEYWLAGRLTCAVCGLPLRVRASTLQREPGRTRLRQTPAPSPEPAPAPIGRLRWRGSSPVQIVGARAGT